jgi:protein-disulfide isomerase
MNYLANLFRLPILSLLLFTLVFISLPAGAENRGTTSQLMMSDSRDTLNLDRFPTSTKIAISRPKVTPELEEQILEVIQKHPEAILKTLQKYAIEQQKKEDIVKAKALEVAKQDLKASLNNSPSMGAKDRKIVLVEFSDFQCPYCSSTSITIKQFMAKHKDTVTFVYKHYPLTQIHPEALPAARAAWAANKQGKFWEYHDALFAKQNELGEALYIKIATNLKLNLKQFNIDRQQADPAIATDFSLGERVGVEGTPTLLLNGEVVGGSVADLEKALGAITIKQ